MITGQPLADDPRLHLWRARSWVALGEPGKAQSELRAAAALTPRDPRVWLAIGQIQSAADGLRDKANLSLDSAVELAGGDPLPWIARGRWHAERGEQEQADADYAKAAALTPLELNRFLEAGWWVIGPYPRDLNDFCPPELDQNPSTPVHVIDPQSGFSDNPAKWTSIPTGDFGRLELAQYDGAKGNVSCYALAHIYSPQEATAALCFSSSGVARIWVNGEVVHYYQPSETPLDWSRDPAVRLGDHPYDRGMDLARYGQWKEAADLLEAGLRRSSEFYGHKYPLRFLAALRLAAGDREAVRKLYAELAAHHQGTTDIYWKYALIQIGTLAPDIADDLESLVKLAEDLRGEKQVWIRSAIPAAYARAGRWQDVINFFAGDDEVRTSMPDYATSLLAMAYHQLGRKADAQTALARMHPQLRGIVESQSTRWPINSVNWGLILPREVSQMLTGSAADVEAKFDEFYRLRRADRDRFAHETREFDAAVQQSPNGMLPSHEAYLARGKRFAELGRLAEAAADFNQAVTLKPNDPDVFTERALYLADNGEPQKAAADFDAALKLLQDQRPPRWHSGIASMWRLLPGIPCMRPWLP